MKILAKVSGEYVWCDVDRIDTNTYTIPLYIATVLHGRFRGEKIATCNYLDKAETGAHIDHALPLLVNAA